MRFYDVLIQSIGIQDLATEVSVYVTGLLKSRECQHTMKTMSAAHVRTQAISPEPYATETPSMVEMRSTPSGLMSVASPCPGCRYP
jgi:hypothetical protein